VIIVATGTPYDIAAFPEATAFLTTYSFLGVAMESAAKIITGGVNPRGKLPISIPSLTHPEQMLYPYGFGLRFH
jgi:beta-N-acetylhexosaminidase